MTAIGAVDASGLESWTPLVRVAVLFGVAVVVLAYVGRRSGERDWLLWIPAGLERITGIPAWAGAMIGTATIGLLTAGIGFYNDVTWHIALGRDEELFTAPHTMIVIGLQLFVVAGGLGIFFASIQRADVGFRWAGLRVPRSAAAMVLVGASAVAGFPLDELWHLQFGIDVTMWSPTHLLMIVGASVTPLVSWLALAEAGVRPSDSWWARGVHLVVALMLLDGLSSVQGEFDFGVPQFQHLYIPVLALLAGGVVMVAVRLAHGPGWVFVMAAVMLVTRFSLGDAASEVDLAYRPSAIYLGSAVAVELVAWMLGTQRRLRFAVASALGVATLGLAVEWAWNQGAAQPWTTALLPDAVLVGAVAAFGAAVYGVVLGDLARLRRPGLSAGVLVAGGLALLLALAWPYPRRVGDVTAAVTLPEAGDGTAHVEVVLDPPDAADGARWFQASAWQGGGLELADMEEVAPGRWRSERPVPVSAPWKTLLRLHRGAEMMAIPLYLPADEEIEGPRGEEFPAVDKVADFEKENLYLLREQQGGSAAVAVVIPAVVLGAAISWVLAFVWVARRVEIRPELEAREEPEPVR